MDDNGLEEHTAGSWNPALRPNDDQHEGSSPTQPSPSAKHDLDSYAVKPEPDAIPSATANKQLPSLSISADKVPQKVHPRLNAGPHEFDALGPRIAEQITLPEHGPHIFQQPSHVEESAESQSSAEEVSGQGRVNASLPETSGPNNGSTSGLGLSWGEGRTRLVAQEERSELSSDEDDERLDSVGVTGWSGTQQRLGPMERSSSFPALPVDSESKNSHAINHLPVTQAEAVMTDLETHAGTDNGTLRPGQPSEQGGVSQNGVLSSALFEGQEDSFFQQLASTNQTLEEPTNAEARFEEGLPLIDSESRPNDEFYEQHRPLQPAEDQAWSASGNENELIFSGHSTTSTAENTSNPPVHLERKATSDVFKSLNFTSNQASDALRHADDQASSLQPTQQQKDGWAQGKTPDGNGGTDVSALWEAVLDDDDFLAEDDDGLLPDSSPQSSPNSASSFLGSLNDGTNFQEPNEVLSAYDSLPSRGGFAAGNDQRRQPVSQQNSNPYAPHQPSSSDLAQMSPTTYGNVGLSRLNLAPMNFAQNSIQGQFQRPSAPSKAESFVDQSKGGYKSPYDLPMDLSKPRKRIQMHQPPPAPKAPAAPPRSSSMTSDQRPGSSVGPLQSPFSPANATFEGQARPSSQNSAPPSSSVNERSSNEQPNSVKAKAGSSSFFEDLPITAKPRPPTAQGRFPPAQTGVLPPPSFPTSPAIHQSQSPTQMPFPPVPVKQSSMDSYSQYQLQRPERLDPYANVPLQPSAAPVVPTTRYSPAPPTSQTAPPSSRYSPAPPGSQIAPPPSAPSRYSPAPPPQPTLMQTQNRYASQSQQSPQLPPLNAIPQTRHPSQTLPPVANAFPFQPRTSSPLAYHGKKSDPPADVPFQVSDRTPTSPAIRVPPPQHVPPRRDSPPASGPPESGHGFAPPRRSQTQSPGRRGPVSSLMATSIDTTQRPASVHGPSSPIASASAYQSFPPARPSLRQRGLSQHLNFISPTDGSQHDELQRWRGSPIFRFGLGGSVLSSFPKHIPRYSAGSTMPMIKPMAGEVQLRNAKEIFSFPEHVAKFPGPLRSKSKKKEVLAWLSDRIVAMESMPIPSVSQPLPDAIKRHDERILLWKVVRVIIEHDGAVDGNAEVQKATNLVLSPESTIQDLPPMDNVMSPDGAGIYKPAGTVSSPEAINATAVESIRKSLLRGEREKAVWSAVDNRLWSHAMLLSSTLDKSVWKQVAHEFIRQEVKLTGVNTESLAALYEIFAGNLEESIDELVPLSARAGLQMVSKVGGAGPTKSALAGLDRWRETLGLVLNNRSPEDQKALAALGRLLASYGRIEASHICHLFASSPMLPNVFGGVDDPQASIVLLGADHRNQPNGFLLDEDAILLTEVYEFASSILASNSKTTLMPHLQAYKLQHVKSLAEAGFKTEAQAYCDAMGASLRSTTKLSPYYHPQFLAELDELARCLSQAPTEPSSWISKPTMGKVSDSMWNKFTTFVAGDESDAASTGSGRDAGHEFGPFAKVSGTPTVSRSGSSTDLHSTYAAAAPQSVPNTIASSRYAPNGQYSTRSSSELTRGRPSLDSQRSPSYLPQGTIQRSPYDPNASLNQQSSMSSPNPAQSASPYAPLGASPPVQPYQGTPPQTSYMPIEQPEDQASPYKPRLSAYVPTTPSEQPQPYTQTLQSAASLYGAEPRQPPTFNSYSPAAPELRAASPQTNSNHPPPLQPYGSYEPPSAEFVPYQPDPSSDSESESQKAKKKSFMNDDDDFPSSTFAPQNDISAGTDDAAAAAARKKANDAAAEAAFRAAAEADATKDNKSSTNQDKTLKTKPSWFGSLFSRKESDSLDSQPSKGAGGGGSQGQKVIRAKLGEDSSFHYDTELKKWVHKKDPVSLQVGVKATPPPPKGPVGRVVSESLGSATAGPTRSGGLMAPPPSLSSSRPTSSNGPPSRAGTPNEQQQGIASPGLAPPALGDEGTESAPPTTAASTLSAAGSGGGLGPGPGLAPPTAPPIPRPASTALSTASDIGDLLGGPPSVGGRRPGGTLKAKKSRAGAGRYVDVMAK